MNIRSIAEYDSIITKLDKKYSVGNEHRLLYRGHSNHNNYELLPGIFRRISEDNKLYTRPCNQDEKAILLEYKAGCDTEFDNKTLSELAQHYCVPTRQLDFTADPYVALYFACESTSENDDYPSVWLLDRVNYSELFFANEKSVDCSWNSDSIVKKIIQDEIFDKVTELHDNPDRYVIRPYIYKPKWKDLREINQKSWFMIWGARQDPLDVIVNLNRNNVIDLRVSTRSNKEQILGVITIGPRYKERILNELSDIGYDYQKIYPTLPNHGEQVKKNNTNTKNSQYKEYRSGGVTIVFQEVKPNKDSW